MPCPARIDACCCGRPCMTTDAGRTQNLWAACPKNLCRRPLGVGHTVDLVEMFDANATRIAAEMVERQARVKFSACQEPRDSVRQRRSEGLRVKPPVSSFVQGSGPFK